MNMRIKALAIAILFILMTPFLRAQSDTLTDAERAEMEEMQRIQDILNKKMDQMLDSWYVKHANANAQSVLNSYNDTNVVCDANMDSIYRIRLSRIMSVVQLGYNSTVRSYINLYINRKKSASATLGLAKYYFPWMTAIFDKYDVPEELVYLTIIESSLNPTAVSPAGATGIWQFMYGTGKMYGLEVNSFVDDRRDPVKATDAAARHLRDLYNIFNDWGLAISAYNCGANNVRKAIARSGGKETFWEIRPYLPKETQNYFPAYIGAYYMMKYYKMHGISPANISIPSDVDTIMVSKEVHFEQIAHVLNIDIDEIKILNPQYKRNVIPAFTEPYPLKLRHKDINRFMILKDSIYRYNYDTYFAPLQMYVSNFTGKPAANESQAKKKYHTVKSGESLTKIANKYGLSVDELKKMNHLKSNYIKAGQKLIVGYTYPTTSSSTATNNTPTSKENSGNSSGNTSATTGNSGTTTSTTTSSSKPTTSTSNYTVYVVKKGDTLQKIAQAHKTTVKRLAEYNKIANVNSLKVGQKIKIPK